MGLLRRILPPLERGPDFLAWWVVKYLSIPFTAYVCCNLISNLIVNKNTGYPLAIFCAQKNIRGIKSEDKTRRPTLNNACKDIFENSSYRAKS
ncbi:Os01g0795250 [Oryza sativa Japonica Group]|uniref:Os01g0795250 protein n=1 Tax=Oryza sativa subsp. japonica TaxID=39947 RepID=A0A0P0V975_ORYSJ|nr:hypothetical protein EE612_006260 [Oryza sativa]BAS74750.1 Os01g0795250 [Oryza sativa Japonica Group]